MNNSAGRKPMDEKIKVRVRSLTQDFINDLYSSGVQYIDIASSLSVRVSTIYSWLSKDGPIPKKETFIQLARANYRIKKTGKRIGNTFNSKTLSNILIGGIIGNAILGSIGAVIGAALGANREELDIIDTGDLKNLTNEDTWDVIIKEVCKALEHPHEIF